MVDAPLERKRAAKPLAWVRAGAGRLATENVFTAIAVGLIFLLGVSLRFNGLGWDVPRDSDITPLQLHPDERFLSIVADAIEWPDSPGQYFDTGASPLNPLNSENINHFVYGTFPLFIAKGAATLAGEDSYATTVEWGRQVTALVDSLTVLVVFAIAALLFGRVVGMIGSALYALAVLPTQLAHFWTVDPYVTFFGALTMLLSILWIRHGRAEWILLAGVVIGLGLASKVTAWPMAMLPVLALFVRIGLRDGAHLGLRFAGAAVEGEHDWPPQRSNWALDGALLAVCAVIALVVFRIAQPYAFAGPGFLSFSLEQRWEDGIFQEIDFQNGNADFPPFVQFADATPVLTPLTNLVVWGTGPALGIAGFAGLALAGIYLFRRRDLTLLLPVAYAIAIVAFQGPRFVAFMRYFAPLYPVLCILAAWALLVAYREGPAALERARSRFPRLPRVETVWVQRGVLAVGALVVGATAFWAFAFQAIYRQEHPRIAATEWIYANVEPGAGITFEIWDDALPLQVPGAPGSYRIIQTDPYRTDSAQKMQDLVYGDPAVPDDGLDGTDYVAITSNRVRDSVTNLELEYRATIQYYELLESGALGFERVATFTSHPTFLGVSIDDSGSEESFTVYDHPEVRIYQKTAAWDPVAALRLLLEAHPEQAENLLPRQGATNGLQYTPAEAAVQQSGGTFDDVFDANGWASGAPWLWWLIWLEVAGFAALGATTWLFRGFPDRGYGYAKLAGLIGVVLPVWLLVAWGVADFSRGLTWVVFGGMVAAGLGVAGLRWRTLVAEGREHWRTWLAAEAVFLGAFFLFLALRAWNPDAWNHPLGGEKPMELAYLTAITRSTEFPPYDPWFAGGYLNYYYMGWFFLAVPMRMFQIVPEVGFNLGVPMFASMAAVVAYSTVSNLVGMARTRAGSLRPGRRTVLAGVWGMALLVLAGNLDAGHQWIERLQAVNTWSLAEGVPVVGGAVGIAGGLWQWVQGAQLPAFDWWRSSRVHIGAFDITEFPYFSFLFADLHPHLMDIPFFGLLLALAVAYLVSVQKGLRAQTWVVAAAMGGMVGLVRTVHTWDFPTVVLVTIGAIALGQIYTRGSWERRFWQGAGHLVLAGAVAFVPYLPYTSHFETFNAGLVRAPETTPPQQYFAHFGVFVVVALLFLAVRYGEERHRNERNLLVGLVATPAAGLALAMFVTGVFAVSYPFGVTTIALSAIGAAFFVNLLWLEWQEEERNLPRIAVTAFYALAIAIAAGVDIVTLKDDIVRMNTVFKFSLQSWHLFAIASGFAGWYVLDAVWSGAGTWRSELSMASLRARWPAFGATATVAILVFAASLYPVSGTPVRQDVRFDTSVGPTLNGLAYLQSDPVFVDSRGNGDPADDVPIDLREDLPLIQWLRANVEGTPVIAEASGNLYTWSSRVAINTGLPTVIGWDWHQVQQRGDYSHLIGERRTDTALFFQDGSVDQAQQYLRRYNVRYVVVGSMEHIYGTDFGLAKFERMDSLTKVFETENGYAIYEVDKARLPLPLDPAGPQLISAE